MKNLKYNLFVYSFNYYNKKVLLKYTLWSNLMYLTRRI